MMDFFLNLPDWSTERSNICSSSLFTQTVGRIWKSIYHIPYSLYQIIQSIKNIIANLSIFNEIDKQPSSSKPVANSGDLYSNSSLDWIIYDSEGLCSLKDSPVSVRVAKIVETVGVVKNDHDPLSQMETLDVEDDLTHHHILKPFEKEEIEQAIEKKIEELFLPVKILFEEISAKEFVYWEDYLHTLDELDQIQDSLSIVPQSFSKLSPSLQGQIGSEKSAIEEKRGEIQTLFCEKIKSTFKPDQSIPSDGDCLFWSIESHLKEEMEPAGYRQQAAKYIRKHPFVFEDLVKDARLAHEANSTFEEYAKILGGKQALFQNLKEKLGRDPTQIDFYCDCLENTTLWGGRSEIIALSEVFQVQILIFTYRGDSENWRFDYRQGDAKFKGKEPVLLYFNGINHYQSLIKR